MLAFFIDQIIMITEKSAIEFLSKRPVYSFFEDIKSIIKHFVIDSYDDILGIISGRYTLETKIIKNNGT